jgi:hypothetical protein
MSGLCLSAFILALVLSLAAFISLWPGVLLPLALAIIALFTVDGRVRRGRAFAWWALGLSVGTGIWGYTAAAGMRWISRETSVGVLSALRAEGSDADRDRLLDSWIAADAPAGTREKIRARFLEALRRAGPVRGQPIPGTVWGGVFSQIFPPVGVKPVDGGDGQDAPPLMALWVRLPCEKAELRMAMVVADKDPEKLQASLEKTQKHSSGSVGPFPILHDLRFYAYPQDLPPEPPAAPPAAPAPVPDPAGR